MEAMNSLPLFPAHTWLLNGSHRPRTRPVIMIPTPHVMISDMTHMLCLATALEQAADAPNSLPLFPARICLLNNCCYSKLPFGNQDCIFDTPPSAP